MYYISLFAAFPPLRRLEGQTRRVQYTVRTRGTGEQGEGGAVRKKARPRQEEAESSSALSHCDKIVRILRLDVETQER